MWPEDPVWGLPSPCNETSLPVTLALCPEVSPWIPLAAGEEGTHRSPSIQASIPLGDSGGAKWAWLCRSAAGMCFSQRRWGPLPLVTQCTPGLPKHQAAEPQPGPGVCCPESPEGLRAGRSSSEQPQQQPRPTDYILEGLFFPSGREMLRIIAEGPFLVCSRLARCTMIGGCCGSLAPRSEWRPQHGADSALRLTGDCRVMAPIHRCAHPVVRPPSVGSVLLMLPPFQPECDGGAFPSRH